MICHHAPGKNFQAFVLLAKSETLQQNVFIFISGKNINPFHNGETYKVYSFGIMEFIIAAHFTKVTNIYHHAKGFARERGDINTHLIIVKKIQ
jgi:hypothetical protein